MFNGKILAVVVGMVASAVSVFAQSAPSSIAFQTPPPATSVSVSASVVGRANFGVFYYWVVVNYPIGSSVPIGPAVITNAPSPLTASNFVRVSWNAVPGASSYTVLRNTVNSVPANGSTSTVAVNTAATSVVNDNTALGVYSAGVTVGTVQGTITLNNRDYPSPRFVANPPFDASGFTCGGDFVCGGASIAATHVVVGSGPGVVTSSNAFTWNGATVAISGSTFGQYSNSVGDLFITNNAASGALILRANGVEGIRLASTSRNVLLGGSTDGNFRLDVQSSGFSGTARFFEQGAILPTQVVVRASTAQGSANLMTFQNAAGAALGHIASDSAFVTTSRITARPSGFGTVDAALSTVGFATKSTGTFTFSSTSDADGAKDASISRFGASTIQIGDGGANSNGLIRARSLGGTDNAATLKFYQFDQSIFVSSDFSINWRSTTNADGGSSTISLTRLTDATLRVGDGGANSNGYIHLTGIRPVPRTVATLPTASGNQGMMAAVTDATVTTIGTTVAGGGANWVMVVSNGTNWRIFAN